MQTRTTDLRFFNNELKRFIYKRVKDKELTEDIVHDVYLKVQNNINQLHHDEKITGWIYKIARNAITDYFRSKSKVIKTHDLDWESDSNVLNDCVSYCLNEMLLTLPEKYREAIELTEIQNLSQTDLAIKLGISYSGAKSRVQRARQMLKERMDDSYRIKTDSYGNVIVCENRVPCGCSQSFKETC
ncbi:MAG TPA: RNA polymerase sigma factor SigZ [Cyclobacteriaceae bacterium]|jgi:RNA polymerase sigma-70 factor (ECF subfamily)|nr:RNA polymerase sigma factor SigZ [Cyclobacteriaceae bacterium]